ncbi:MAG: hypothetical protein GXP13_10745 [Gammaproteobacteria bacterium]|nr:hypothetical protein [Gammaproteobacteria bacterium]
MNRNNPGLFNRFTVLALLATMLVVSGCSNRFEDQLRKNQQIVANNLIQLKSQLDNKQLVNALLINKYASTLREQKPDYADITRLMQLEATSKGKAYNALVKRLANVNLSPTNNDAATLSFKELQLIQAAADPLEFNNALADVVNTLASLSDGQLAAVNIPASQRSNAQQGSALVGNPAYGNWSRGSDGRSFWAWYGMYSMLGNVFGRPYYNTWSSRPHYSYYGNYGRNRWGSDTDVTRNRNLRSRYPSQYNKPSAATKNRYARTSSRSSSYGGSSSRSGKSAYGSSSRSSSFSSSRSSRSGK